MPAPIIITRPAFTDVDSIPATVFNGVTIRDATVPDATAGAEGVMRLAGDLTGGANSPQLITSGVVAGTYGDSGDNIPQFTVDAKGRITSAANRQMPNTAVMPGTYGAFSAEAGLRIPQLTIDQKGRITAAIDRNLLEHVKFTIYDTLYPVGEVLITLRSGNPATWIGFGTWVPWGEGRALVGHNGADSDFNAVEKTGGEKTVTLTENQIPAHGHGIPALTGSTSVSGAHSHLLAYGTTSSGGAGLIDADGTNGNNAATTSTDTTGLHTHGVTTNASTTGSSGNGQAHNNLQPYIVAFFWKRTA